MVEAAERQRRHRQETEDQRTVEWLLVLADKGRSYSAQNKAKCKDGDEVP